MVRGLTERSECVPSGRDVGSPLGHLGWAFSCHAADWYFEEKIVDLKLRGTV